MWISKRRWESLVKRVTALENKFQEQQLKEMAIPDHLREILEAQREGHAHEH